MTNMLPDEPMQRITAVLETPPNIPVPGDFAARVMAKLPPPTRRRIVLSALPSPARYGRFALAAAMVLLVSATLLLAPLTRGSALWLTLQLVLLLQLGVLVFLFGWTRNRQF